MPRFVRCVGLSLLVFALASRASAADLPLPGVCMREGARLVGRTPVQAGKGVPQARKTRAVTPTYPNLAPGTVFKGGPWVGEVLVDQRGTVVEVWTIREVGFNPPFPAFNQAIVDALRQGRFEPLVLKGQSVPWCSTVSIFIDWA